MAKRFLYKYKDKKKGLLPPFSLKEVFVMPLNEKKWGY